MVLKNDPRESVAGVRRRESPRIAFCRAIFLLTAFSIRLVCLFAEPIADSSESPSTQWPFFAQDIPSKLGSLLTLPSPPTGFVHALFVFRGALLLNNPRVLQPPDIRPIDRIIQTVPVPVVVAALFTERVKGGEAAGVGV